ncbi:iron-binding zinc finger CDGSH type-domain-containing protein [Fennellomyces sp. T-0311]|nr:iron-binding zinc finger CDGSH type-domain-containing protein [Fennellomyces sp. T-0311]
MASSSQEKAPEPTFVQPMPYKVHLEPGKEYYWCTCGESKNQPFCDGTHRGGPFKPKKIVVEEAKTYPLCGCKFTHNEQGFCDGTHRKEEGIRKYNEFLLKANGKLKEEHEKAKVR